MNRATEALVWLSRIGHCRGFGIQSPTDYWFVRNVINQDSPYYKYDELGKGEGHLSRKLGRLYFRMANWVQPRVAYCQSHRDYFQAGALKTRFVDTIEGCTAGELDLMQLTLTGDYRPLSAKLMGLATSRTVLIVEGIWRDWDFWHELIAAEKARVTFDLYYCGIVMFDEKRAKQNYKINF